MHMLGFHRSLRSVRGRVSVAVNGALILLFVSFLAYDYQHDSADRLERKHTSLEEQARILAPMFRDLSREELVKRISEVRTRMSATHSDSHVVAAEANGEFFQSGVPEDTDGSASARAQAFRVANTRVIGLGGKDYLAGIHREGALVVYVAEDLGEIREAIRADMLRHLASVVIALLGVTVIINVVLWLVLQRPLVNLATAVGEIGAGDYGLQLAPVGVEECDILVTAINAMARSLAAEERIRSAQMRQAHAIQRSLLPARMSHGGVVIAHHFQPAEAVGGDYYDLIPLPDGSALLCLADVSGHGVPAALVAAMVKICLLDATEFESDPGKVLGFVDRRLSAMNLPDTFVSMILIRLAESMQDLEYAGAGHPAALLAGRDCRYRELESDGPVLGIGVGFEWTTRQEPFSPGDRLVLYTDGVTEASSPKLGLLGSDRLKSILSAARREPPNQAITQIVAALGTYLGGQPAQDDITLLMVERPAEQRGSDDADDEIDQLHHA